MAILKTELKLDWLAADSPLWETVIRFAQEHDKDFVPPISDRMPVRDYIERFRQPHGKMLVVLSAAEVVGCMGVFTKHPERGTAFLQYGAVAEEYRKAGLATALVQVSLEMLIEHSCKYVETRTWSTNKASRRLFEAQGFVVTEVLPDDRCAGVDTLIFGKTL